MKLLRTCDFLPSRPSARLFKIVPRLSLERLLLQLSNCVVHSVEIGDMSIFEAEEILFNFDTLYTAAEAGINRRLLDVLDLGCHLSDHVDLIVNDTVEAVFRKLKFDVRIENHDENLTCESWSVIQNDEDADSARAEGLGIVCRMIVELLNLIALQLNTSFVPWQKRIASGSSKVAVDNVSRSALLEEHPLTRLLHRISFRAAGLLTIVLGRWIVDELHRNEITPMSAIDIVFDASVRDYIESHLQLPLLAKLFGMGVEMSCGVPPGCHWADTFEGLHELQDRLEAAYLVLVRK